MVGTRSKNDEAVHKWRERGVLTPPITEEGREVSNGLIEKPVAGDDP